MKKTDMQTLTRRHMGLIVPQNILFVSPKLAQINKSSIITFTRGLNEIFGANSL